MGRRTRIDIFADILKAARELQNRDEGHIPPSRITSMALIPHDRGRRYLKRASECALIDANNNVTEKGELYLVHYSRLQSILGEGV